MRQPPGRAGRRRCQGAPVYLTSCFPLPRRDLARDLISSYFYGGTARPGRTEEPSDRMAATGRARRLAHRLRDPVDHDREEQDADPRDHRGAEVMRQTVDHLVAEAL